MIPFEAGDDCPRCTRARAVERGEECLFMQDGLECVEGVLLPIQMPEIRTMEDPVE